MASPHDGGTTGTRRRTAADGGSLDYAFRAIARRVIALRRVSRRDPNGGRDARPANSGQVRPTGRATGRPGRG